MQSLKRSCQLRHYWCGTARDVHLQLIYDFRAVFTTHNSFLVTIVISNYSNPHK